VHSTLRALFSDLEVRCLVLLGSLPAVPPAEIATRIEELRTKIGLLRSEARALLGENLEDPSAASAHYEAYVRHNRIVFEAEHFELPILLRWGDQDRQMTAMCSALLSQVGWQLVHPQVGTISHEYYWALPSRQLIAVPANEHERLLAIGDLAHELGHLAFAKHGALLVGDTLQRVSAYVKLAVVSSHDPAEFAFQANTCWREWIQEFVCDAFAAYLTGPAFAFQNLRLCCLRGALEGVFDVHQGRAHPADDARMRVALHMLGVLGLGQVAGDVQMRWEEALALVGAAPRGEYDLMLPNALLEAVAQNVHDACKQLGLRAYDPSVSGDCDVARLANEAWERLLSDPPSYETWERQTLLDCQAVWSA
jgi:hypothetical protein